MTATGIMFMATMFTNSIANIADTANGVFKAPFALPKILLFLPLFLLSFLYLCRRFAQIQSMTILR